MSLNTRGKFTSQEILSQPDIWSMSLAKLSQLNIEQFPDISSYERVIFTGCGSTFFLSRWAARACEAERGVVCRAAPASDLFLFPDAWLNKDRKTLLVAVSRSAQTTETIRALEHFQEKYTGDAIVVTCYPGRSLGQLTPHIIAVPDAQEESVAQTRSFTNMLLAVTWLITRGIPAAVSRTFSSLASQLFEQITPLAERLGRDVSISKIFFLGSGPLYGIANEAMLKMKEMSLTYSESFHFLEFRHGPMSMVDEESLVVGLISDPARDYEFALMQEMKKKGARVLAICEQDQPKAGDLLDEKLMLNSGLPEIWRSPLFLPLLQLLAYERAMVKGLDPDKPANLSSVVFLKD